MSNDELTQHEVRAIRKRLAMNVEQFAKQLRVSQSTVESWEMGRRPCRGPVARLLWLMREVVDG